VIPTFIIDEPALIFIGLFAGYFVPKDWTGSLLKTRAFFAGSVIALGFMGLAAYGYAKAPDWMFAYLIPASQVPFWMVVYIFVLYYFLFLAGFFLYPQLRRIHPALALLALVLSIIASVVVVLPVNQAYQTIATYEEFHQGRGVALSESEIGRHSMIPGVALLIVGVALLMWARRQKNS